MGRIKGRREVVHQLFWDTWWRGANGTFTPNDPIQNSPTLFGNSETDLGIGNKLSAGIFPDQNVFKMLGMRNYLVFMRMGGPATLGGNVDDLLMMAQAQCQCFYTLKMSQKEEFQAPAWYLPAGGGLFGDIGGATDRQLLNNGEPTPRAALQFAKPLTVSPNQLFTVKCEAVAVGVANIITDLNNANSTGLSVNTLGVEGIFVRAAL